MASVGTLRPIGLRPPLTLALALMDFTFWQMFGSKIVLGSIVAFGLAWCTRDKWNAYRRGLLASVLVLLVPSCVPMFQSDPIAANGAAEEFFWIMVPLLRHGLVGAVIAIWIARIVRWKE